jgi:hypothetical protein
MRKYITVPKLEGVEKAAVTIRNKAWGRGNSSRGMGIKTKESNY